MVYGRRQFTLHFKINYVLYYNIYVNLKIQNNCVIICLSTSICYLLFPVLSCKKHLWRAWERLSWLPVGYGQWKLQAGDQRVEETELSTDFPLIGLGLGNNWLLCCRSQLPSDPSSMLQLLPLSGKAAASPYPFKFRGNMASCCYYSLDVCMSCYSLKLPVPL